MRSWRQDQKKKVRFHYLPRPLTETEYGEPWRVFRQECHGRICVFRSCPGCRVGQECRGDGDEKAGGMVLVQNPMHRAYRGPIVRDGERENQESIKSE